MNPPLAGKIVEESTDGTNRIGMVEFGGKRRSIYLNLVPNVHTGDYVKFQAGFAIERLDNGGDDENISEPADGRDLEPDLKSIQAYSLLCDLDPTQIRKLLPLAQEENFAAGQIIFRAGERSLYLHLIVSGEVTLEDTTGDEPIAVQTLGAGDAMGWSALTLKAQRQFQARALSPVATVAFDGAEMREVCDRDPVLGYALMNRLLEMVTERLEAVRRKLEARSDGGDVRRSL